MGNLATVFPNLSTVPNDFRYDNINTLELPNGVGMLPGCAGGQITLWVVNPNDPVVAGCRVKPHTTYYLNIRNEDARKVDPKKSSGNNR